MGALQSRQLSVEEVDIGINHAYKYPPRTGQYFSNHFIMGGEKFDTAHPEMYLFGENSDLNFLGTRPMPFPYPCPANSEPSKTLRALINVRKESLRFVRVPDNSSALKESDNQSTCFNVEFTFDSDVRCSVTIMYFCTEEISSNGLIYTPKDEGMNSETYHYKSGANQQFSQVFHVFDPSRYPEEDLTHTFDRDLMPVVIYCQTEDDAEAEQAHATIAIVERYSDGYTLKPLKQKLYADGLCYLIQEIYGIENKNADNSKINGDDEQEDNGAECVICMCDLRDTLILPCRHLCLCYSCADSLRFQANNCPICRAPFRALLQIKALQKSSNPSAPPAEGSENIPAGYEAVSLIEALNGPSENSSSAAQTTDTSTKDGDSKTRSSAVEESATQTDYQANNADPDSAYKPAAQMNVTEKNKALQIRMSTLLAQEDALTKKLEEATLPKTNGRRRKTSTKEDSTTTVAEKGGANCGLHGRLKKSVSASSPVSAVVDIGAKSHLKMYRSESDGIDDPGETLRLLVPQTQELSKEQEATETLQHTIDDATRNDESDIPRSHSFRDSKSDHLRLSDRPPLRKQSCPTRRHSSRRRTSQLGDSDDRSGGTGETQSLPGTPLSTTSAVSRSSDASVSSASSTRALIISHPSQGSNSAV